jgi:thiol:disulfide interchange protein DsbD
MRLLVPLILPMLPLLAAEEKKVPVGVDVSLVAENVAIAAGTPFRVGLRIHHHEGFHTYWQNPGIAGVPTNLTWKLPDGFSAGPIQWPFPEKTMMAIYPVHGYERDVMLLVDITPPAALHETKVRLQATATWMACADGCYPGSAELELILPVSPKPESDPAVQAAFAKAEAEIPSPLENWSVTLLSAKDAKEIRFRLTPASTTAAVPENVWFFSSDGQVSSDQPQRIETGKDGSLVITVARSEQSPKGKTTLPGVLKSTVPWGKDGKTSASIEPAFPSTP